MKNFNYHDYKKFLQMKDKIDLSNLLLKEFDDELFGLKDTSEKYIINNPHDKIFRTILGNKKQIVETINTVIMQEEKLTEEDIEKYNSSYINERFENRESDVVYKMKNRNIFFLIEHQTKVDYDMPRRILSYELEIMKEALGHKRITKNNDKLPMVVPIVIYTGRKKWNVAKYIQECQEKLKGAKELKFGEYYIVDINDYSYEELKKEKSFLAKIMLLEKTKDKKEFIENLKTIIESEKNLENIELLERMIYYIFEGKIGKENAEMLMKKIRMKGGDKMELAVVEMLKKEDMKLKRQALKEGIAKGRAEGKAEGMAEKTRKIVEEMLKIQLDDEIIKKVTKINSKELKKIKEEMCK